MTREQALENKKNRIKSNNSINILYPYKEGNVWYYDDPDIGVYKEAFVLGSSETIDRVLGEGTDKCKMLISQNPIPNYSARIGRRKDIEEQLAGMLGWYQLEGTDMVNWLCAEVLAYFSDYPDSIYVKFENI